MQRVEPLGSERKGRGSVARQGSSCWGSGERRMLFSGVIYPGAGEGPLSSTLQLEPTVLLLGPMFMGPLSHPPYCSSCQLQN